VQAAVGLADTPPSQEQIAAQRAALVRDLDYIPAVVEHHMQALVGGKHA